MSKYITSVVSTVVHMDDRNPIFGDDIITITIDDEACGGYIVLTQNEQTTRSMSRKVKTRNTIKSMKSAPTEVVPG